MMNNKKSISDYTEAEFLALVVKIFNPDNTTEDEDIQNVLEFESISEHPDGSDVIFYPPKGREDSPQGVVKEVKEWRAKNGKPDFKGS